MSAKKPASKAPTDKAARQSDQQHEHTPAGVATPLRPKHARFVQEYLLDLNGTQAVIRAGYATRGADVQAVRLLGNARIKAAIDAKLAERAQRTGVTADRVLAETEAIAFSCIDHYQVGPTGHLELAPGAPADAMRAVASVKRKERVSDAGTEYEVEFRLWNKPEVLKLAGRHAGVRGFAERMELTGPGGGPIETKVDLSALSVEELRAMRDLMRKATSAKA